MASKIITGDQAGRIEPVIWRGTPGSQQVKPRQAGVTPGSGPNDPNQIPDADHVRVLMNQQSRIQELERELESRPRLAYQQGHGEGITAGAQQAAARLEPVMAKLADSIRDLAALRRRYLQDAEEDAVKLAIAVARKVLHRELTVDPESLLGVIKAAFDRVDARDVHRVRANPEDVPILQRHLSSTGMPPRVEVTPDASLERGGIIIETSRGCLDASVTSQLREIEGGLTDLVRRSPG